MAGATDPAVSSALERLAREDTILAGMAEAALEAVTAGDGLEALTQLDLQTFLWHELPTTWDLPRAEQEGIAHALGKLFDILGYGRYAAICRSDATSAVLEAYAHGERQGMAEMRRASGRSGVDPPDLPGLGWGELMGPVEQRAHRDVAGTLELSCMAGDLRPGARGWRSAQRRLTADALTRPRADLAGLNLREAVTAERVELWTTSGGEARQRLLEPLADRLREAVPAPSDTSGLAPLRWLLDRASDGVALTASGRLARAFVQETASLFGWWELPTPPRDEEEVRQLYLLHGLARDLGAVRSRARRLTLTREGAALTVDHAALWRAASRRMLPPNGFRAAVGELALALLLRDGRCAQDDLVSELRDLLAESGWRDTASGRPPTTEDVLGGLYRLTWLAEPLGILAPIGLDDVLTLTPFGETTALEVLHHRATSPRYAAG